MPINLPAASTRSFVACAAAVTLAFASVPATAYDDLYVFGDSLSDNGNLFAMTGFPPAPYFNGRFSNGPVAVEVLATGLGATLHDFAIAGAQTSTAGNLPGTGMTSQVDGYATLLGGPNADPNALYFVWGGANDLRAAGANAGAAIAPTINNLTYIVDTLYDLGARHFLLPNLPDLGLTPEAIEGGPAAAGGASMLSTVFNANLALAYGGLAAASPGANFIYFDAMAAQTAIVDGVGNNAFTNVTERCLDTRNLANITLCATPNSYLYWDNIHPTAAAHAMLGQQMLAAVPEPQTLLMMAVGVLGLLGWSRRRAQA
jgi:phospholipase/lecithinase/hemolysin